MNAPKLVVHIVAAALMSLWLCAASSAAPIPMSQPEGLALDKNGNLYVANYFGNQILVYDVNYNQMTSKTITQNIFVPSGVAFDPAGNLWVSNHGPGTITEYNPKGKQIVSGTITNSVSGPRNIAVDGLGDIWVQNANQYITVYDAFGTLVRNFVPPGNEFLLSLAVHEQWAAFGGETEAIAALGVQYFANNNFVGPGFADNAQALAIDSKDTLYVATGSAVTYISLVTGTGDSFLALFDAGGISVDNTRGRIYVSNEHQNSIAVYNMAGTLIKTIS